MIPVDFRKYFDWIVKSHDPMSILRFLRVKERIERWNEMYNLALWGLSRDTGTPILDIRSPFLASPELPDFYCEDGIHINAAGHKLLCDQLFICLHGLNPMPTRCCVIFRPTAARLPRGAPP
jgi:hypothetical protein